MSDKTTILTTSAVSATTPIPRGQYDQSYAVHWLAFWFHSLPHFNYNFTLIDYKVSSLYDKPYMNSIVVYTVIALLLLVMGLIAYIIFAVIVFIYVPESVKAPDPESKKTKEDPELQKQKKGYNSIAVKDKPINIEEALGMGQIGKISKYVIMGTAVLLGLIYLLGLYSDYRMHNGLVGLHNTSTDAVNFFESLRDDLKNVDPFQFLDIKELVHNLEDLIRSLYLPSAITSKIVSAMDTTVEYLDRTNEEIIKANIPGYNISKIDVKWIPVYIDAYGQIFTLVFIFVFLVMAMTGLLFIFGVISIHLLGIFSIIAIIALLLNAAIMALFLSTSVFVSDLCVDFKPFLWEMINNKFVYDFIVDCQIDQYNLGSTLDNLENFLTKVHKMHREVFVTLVNIVHKYCSVSNRFVNTGAGLLSIVGIHVPQNLTITCPKRIERLITNTVLGINGRILGITQLLQTFRNIADCRRINRLLYKGLTEVCDDLGAGLMYICLTTFLAAICFLTLIFIVTFAMSRVRGSLKEEDFDILPPELVDVVNKLEGKTAGNKKAEKVENKKNENKKEMNKTVDQKAINKKDVPIAPNVPKVLNEKDKKTEDINKKAVNNKEVDKKDVNKKVENKNPDKTVDQKVKNEKDVNQKDKTTKDVNKNAINSKVVNKEEVNKEVDKGVDKGSKGSQGGSKDDLLKQIDWGTHKQ